MRPASRHSQLCEKPVFSRSFAAAGWALFLPAQAYSAILMPTAWAVFIFWLLVWRMFGPTARPALREQFITGLVIGIAAMGVATILFLIPLLLWTAGQDDAPAFTRQAFRSLATVSLFAGVTLGTSPCWIHNYFVARDPVILSAHSGINFWIGNNPDANGYPQLPARTTRRPGGFAAGFHRRRGIRRSDAL